MFDWSSGESVKTYQILITSGRGEVALSLNSNVIIGYLCKRQWIVISVLLVQSV